MSWIKGPESLDLSGQYNRKRFFDLEKLDCMHRSIEASSPVLSICYTHLYVNAGVCGRWAEDTFQRVSLDSSAVSSTQLLWAFPSHRRCLSGDALKPLRNKPSTAPLVNSLGVENWKSRRRRMKCRRRRNVRLASLPACECQRRGERSPSLSLPQLSARTPSLWLSQCTWSTGVCACVCVCQLLLSFCFRLVW